MYCFRTRVSFTQSGEVGYNWIYPFKWISCHVSAHANTNVGGPGFQCPW